MRLRHWQPCATGILGSGISDTHDCDRGRSGLALARRAGPDRGSRENLQLSGLTGNWGISNDECNDESGSPQRAAGRSDRHGAGVLRQQRHRDRIRIRERRQAELEHHRIGGGELARRGPESPTLYASGRFTHRPLLEPADPGHGRRPQGRPRGQSRRGRRQPELRQERPVFDAVQGDYGSRIQEGPLRRPVAGQVLVRPGPEPGERAGRQPGQQLQRRSPQARPDPRLHDLHRSDAARCGLPAGVAARTEPVAQGQVERPGIRGRTAVRKRPAARCVRLWFVRRRQLRPAAAPGQPGDQLGRKHLHPGRQPDQSDRRPGRAPCGRGTQGNPAAGLGRLRELGFRLRLTRGVLPAEVEQHVGGWMRHVLHGDEHADLGRPGSLQQHHRCRRPTGQHRSGHGVADRCAARFAAIPAGGRRHLCPGHPGP